MLLAMICAKFDKMMRQGTKLAIHGMDQNALKRNARPGEA